RRAERLRVGDYQERYGRQDDLRQDPPELEGRVRVRQNGSGEYGESCPRTEEVCKEVRSAPSSRGREGNERPQRCGGENCTGGRFHNGSARWMGTGILRTD